jgi:hypothetical protein
MNNPIVKVKLKTILRVVVPLIVALSLTPTVVSAQERRPEPGRPPSSPVVVVLPKYKYRNSYNQAIVEVNLPDRLPVNFRFYTFHRVHIFAGRKRKSYPVTIKSKFEMTSDAGRLYLKEVAILWNSRSYPNTIHSGDGYVHGEKIRRLPGLQRVPNQNGKEGTWVYHHISPALRDRKKKGYPAYVLERRHVFVPNPTLENTTLVVHVSR